MTKTDKNERHASPAKRTAHEEAAIVEELAAVFSERDSAVLLAVRAGIAKSRLPDFKSPLDFWSKVTDDARHGLLEKGIEALAKEAAKLYPSNENFANWKTGVLSRSLASEDDVESVADLEDRLKIATLAGQSESAEQISAVIVSRKRHERDASDISKGFIFDNRYQLDESLGQGGFGTVWKAYDTRSRRTVAVKILHKKHNENTERKDRFFRGARIMSTLGHSGVVRILQDWKLERGHYYYVMEYVPGGNLHQQIDFVRAGDPWKLYVSLIDTVSYLHQQGHIHRDIKPKNILLRGSQPVLTDFDLVDAPDTTAGTDGPLGTLIYSAPELFKSSEPGVSSVATDIFSLGMIGLFLAHGRKLPIEASRIPAEFVKQLECIWSLKVVFVRATELRPADRFVDAESLKLAVRAALDGREARLQEVDSVEKSENGEKSDQVLLLAWLRDGDRKSGDLLCRKYFPIVLRLVKRYVPSEDAADVVLGAFEALITSPRMKEGMNFKAAILTFARLEVHRWLRAHTLSSDDGSRADDSRPLRRMADEFGHVTSDTTSKLLEKDEGLLLGALRRLPLGDQHLIELKYFSGFDTSTIAELLGCPMSSVLKRLRRARERLRRELEKAAEESGGLDELRSWAEKYEKEQEGGESSS